MHEKWRWDLNYSKQAVGCSLEHVWPVCTQQMTLGHHGLVNIRGRKGAILWRHCSEALRYGPKDNGCFMCFLTNLTFSGTVSPVFLSGGLISLLQSGRKNHCIVKELGQASPSDWPASPHALNQPSTTSNFTSLGLFRKMEILQGSWMLLNPQDIICQIEISSRLHPSLLDGLLTPERQQKLPEAPENKHSHTNPSCLFFPFEQEIFSLIYWKDLSGSSVQVSQPLIPLHCI